MFCCGYALADVTHIFHGYFTGTGAIIRLPQCPWSNPENINEYITWIHREVSCNHSKTAQNEPVYIFYGVYSVHGTPNGEVKVCKYWHICVTYSATLQCKEAYTSFDVSQSSVPKSLQDWTMPLTQMIGFYSMKNILCDIRSNQFWQFFWYNNTELRMESIACS